MLRDGSKLIDVSLRCERRRTGGDTPVRCVGVNFRHIRLGGLHSSEPDSIE